MPNKEFKIDIAKIQLYSNKIIETVIKDNEFIDPEDVVEIKSFNKKLMKDKKCALLINVGKGNTISKDAWNVAISKKYDDQTIAKAIVVKNPVHFLLGEMYLGLNKTFVKTKFFNKKKSALKWLDKKTSKSK
jgi:hypothetical protein